MDRASSTDVIKKSELRWTVDRTNRFFGAGIRELSRSQHTTSTSKLQILSPEPFQLRRLAVIGAFAISVADITLKLAVLMQP